MTQSRLPLLTPAPSPPALAPTTAGRCWQHGAELHPLTHAGRGLVQTEDTERCCSDLLRRATAAQVRGHHAAPVGILLTDPFLPRLSSRPSPGAPLSQPYTHLPRLQRNPTQRACPLGALAKQRAVVGSGTLPRCLGAPGARSQLGVASCRLRALAAPMKLSAATQLCLGFRC